MSTLKMLPYGDKGVFLPEGKLVRVVESEYSPTSEASLEAWYKADSLDLADGASVATWADQSGNSRDLTEATNQPVYNTGQINGFPAILFDGTNDKLRSGAFAVARPWHVFLVMKSISAGFVDGDSFFDGITSNKGRLYFKTASSNITLYAGGTMANYSELGDDTWGILDVSNGSYPQLTAGDAVSLAGGLNAAGTNNLDGVSLGCIGGGTANFGNFQVAEVLLFSEQLRDKALYRVRKYLSDKYNLSVRPDNLVFQTRDITSTSGVWTNSRITFPGTARILHDGKTSTVNEIIDDGSTNTHYISQDRTTMPLVSGAIYKISAYVKAGVTAPAEFQPCIVFHTSTVGWLGAYTTKAFKCSTQTWTTTSTDDQTLDQGYEAADHGWYKIWVVAQTNSAIETDGSFNLLLGIANDSGVFVSMAGNSTSSVLFDNIKVERVG